MITYFHSMQHSMLIIFRRESADQPGSSRVSKNANFISSAQAPQHSEGPPTVQTTAAPHDNGVMAPISPIDVEQTNGKAAAQIYQSPIAVQPVSHGQSNGTYIPIPIQLQTTPAQPQTAAKIIKPKDDRNIELLLKLMQDFESDKSWLAQSVQHAHHSRYPSGIHVFVDFSNIWIGFLNALRSGQFLGRHSGNTDIDFENLVLVLERRRPTAQRVLVGSLPSIPAFQMAESIGYESLILDKVYKDDMLKKLQKQQQYQHANINYTTSNGCVMTPNAYLAANMGGYGIGQTYVAGSVSGMSVWPPLNGYPAPNVIQQAPPIQLKWTEQGVDEVLQNRINQTIVDMVSVSEPGTMVVATGDAAKSEFSQGFLKVLEGALRIGWTVELIAWEKGIHSAYRQWVRDNTWKGRFRVMELDPYAEFLVGEKPQQPV